MLFTYDRVSLCILLDSGIWTHRLFLNRELFYQWTISTYCDVLTQLLHTLLEYTIQHTTFLLSCELLRRLLRSVSGLGFRVPPLTTQTAYEPLGANPRTNALPFLIPADWLVLLGSQHHLLLFMHPGSLAGQSTHILSPTSALLLQPPVLSVIATSR